jgi:hypothetical protein
MFIGCCLYVAIIVYCRKTELDLLGPQCAQRRITKGLAIARVTCIILSIAPVVLAVLAVKNHPLVN